MAKVQLYGLIYTTNDQDEVSRLKELGGTVLVGFEETPEQGEVTKVPEDANLRNLKMDELKAIAEERGLTVDSKITKEQLVALLEKEA